MQREKRGARGLGLTSDGVRPGELVDGVRVALELVTSRFRRNIRFLGPVGR